MAYKDFNLKFTLDAIKSLGLPWSDDYSIGEVKRAVVTYSQINKINYSVYNIEEADKKQKFWFRKGI